MITIAISSQKGGVGKTTVAINLAHAFARSGRRTVLVDADPQGSVGLSLTRQSRLLPGFYDFIDDQTVGAADLLVPTRLDTLSLIPAGQASAYDLSGSAPGSVLPRLRSFLRELGSLDVEVCIIDTAAGLFGAAADVLTAVSAVIVPQQAEPLGIRSVPKMLEALTRMRIVNPQLSILGVVLTMMQSALPESRDAVQALRAILPSEMVMRTVVPRDDLFIKASARGLPAGVMDGGDAALSIFDHLRLEVERKLGVTA
ncbi:MAG: ParA family protein [Roseibacillus sp.]|nr:ParA family protein [Roseibacillus sp.]